MVHHFATLSIDSPEYWKDCDYDIDADFDLTPPAPITNTPRKDGHSTAVWWISVFLCVFRTVNVLPDRAIAWLLSFLRKLFLGQHSKDVRDVALALPTSVYLLEKYMGTPDVLGNVKKFVVCRNCHALYNYSECFDMSRHTITPKSCAQRHHNSASPCGGALIKTVITSTGSIKHYPHRVYCYFDFLFCLKSLLSRKGVVEMCESVRDNRSVCDDLLSDVHTGNLWKSILCYEGEDLLSAPHNYAVLLNVDWFQPYKNINYSVGVIYLTLLNLLRTIRYKRENVILVGIIPGPSEPSLHINTYLSPLITALKDLWEGVSIHLPPSNKAVKVRCILLGVSCDLPAGRKVCGFLSYVANKGCTRCHCSFSEGFRRRNFSNFNRELWIPRTNTSHRANMQEIMRSKFISDKLNLKLNMGAGIRFCLSYPISTLYACS